MSVSRGGKSISGATERLTGVGVTALLILSIKRGNANKVTVTMPSLENARDMYLAGCNRKIDGGWGYCSPD